MTDLICRFWAKTVIIKSVMKQSRHNSGRQVTKELNIAFTYYVASKDFHYYSTAAWTVIYEGEPVTNIESLA